MSKPIAALAALLLAACQAPAPVATPQPEPTPVVAEQPLEQADYDAITEGMSLESVQHILDQDGTEISRAGDDFTVFFDTPGVSIGVVFIDGEVFSKSIGVEEP